jgi:phosphomannomutase/phosphoglucomutase
MKVNSSIFREYDIRGIAGTEFKEKALKEYEKWYGKFPGITITPEVGVAIGKAYGTRIRERGGKHIIIGHEERDFGGKLKEFFIEGVRSTGCDVDDAGVSLTPIIYFSTAYHGYDGGVNVTGSHNVYFYNGFKMMAKDVFPIFGEEIQKMRLIIENDNYRKDKKGKLTNREIFNDYKKYLLKHNKLNKKLKVVVDSGNGSAGLFAPEVLRDLGCEVVDIYSKVDATFPNHMPDPEDPWMMRDLSEKVKEEGADIGIGLDADGDRFGMVDEKGEFHDADRLMLIVLKDILSRNAGKRVIYDVKCTKYLDKLIPGYGGNAVMHVTGHAPIKDTMRRDETIIFSGEISGHFYWAEDYFRIDDGLYSAAKILSLFSSFKKPISHYFKELPKSSMTPEIKLKCHDEKKDAVIEKIKKHFVKKQPSVTIDGIRTYFSDESWALVRASNTSPYISIRMEAENDKDLLRIKNVVQDQLDKHPEVGDKLDRKNVTSHTGKLGWV